MADGGQELTNLRIPLAIPISSRAASLNTDGYMRNCFIDVAEDGKRFAVKRPGLGLFTTFAGGGSATAQNLTYHNGFLLGFAGDQMTRISSLTSSGYATGGSWNNTFNAPWQGRRGAAFVVFQNYMYIIGGTYDGTNNLRDVWRSADGKNWAQCVSGAPWGARQLQRAVVFNNAIYLMGGVDGGVVYNDVWKTQDGVTWVLVTATAAWTGRSAFGLAVFNNGMYLTGGNTGPTEVWFSVDGGNWILITAAPGWAGRSGHGSIAFLDRLYILGGTTNGREVWWTADGKNWTMATNTAFSSARYGFGCVVYNGFLWALSGFDPGAASVTTQIWKSADGINWTQQTAAYGGTGRIHPAAFVFQAPPGQSVINAPVMYLMGGSDNTPTYQQDIWWASVNGTLTTTYTVPVVTSGLPIQTRPCNNNRFLAAKDTAAMYIWYADELKKVTDVNYPLTTVPGIVNLDETIYVMDPDGIIHGSALIEPRVWPSLNFIGADYESDAGVAICKYSNYLMAMGVFTTQFFYNSGAPGNASLLRNVKNMNLRVGCVYPYSVVEMQNTVVWVGRTQESAARRVFAMQGNVPVPISFPAIDRYLDGESAAGFVRAGAWGDGGRAYYILTLPTAGLSFAYDFAMKAWYVFTVLGGVFSGVNTATDGTADYILDDTLRQIYIPFRSTFADNSNPINCVITTGLQDNGTDWYKLCPRITLIGDRTANCTATVSFSNNDYASFSSSSTMTMDSERPTVTRMGRYRRRAWKFTCNNATTAWRVEAAEPALSLGSA